jgi:transposase
MTKLYSLFGGTTTDTDKKAVEVNQIVQMEGYSYDRYVVHRITHNEYGYHYHLINLRKGIGTINALTILVCTQNFTLFENHRQFACYGGIAPFEQSSGSSLNKGRHVSRLADMNIKRLLTQAAKSAVVHDDELRLYCQRKIADGKKWQLVINNVRNKLVSRVFAVVRNKKAYDPMYYRK